MILQGDSKELLKTLEENSVDSIVTDPPYELGFMGKSWDNTGIANDKTMWAECLRVLKPGGYLLSFGGTRTYHRMAVAIEDAGFEVRDMIEWVYGSGFPKSLNIGKAVDKLQGNERETFESKRHGGGSSDIFPERNNKTDSKGTSEWEGWGTALKPAHEPICMARKPLAEKTVAENVLKYGTGGINIDGCRVGTEDKLGRPIGAGDKDGKIYGKYAAPAGTRYGDDLTGRFPANLIHDGSDEVTSGFPISNGSQTTKVGKTYGENDGRSYLQTKPHGVNINDKGSASRFFKSIIYQAKASKSERNRGLDDFEEIEVRGGGGRVEDGYDLSDPDQIGLKEAARKYGAVKAKKANIHPTVKPLALMEYLIKMVTPKGGIVLDPFAGSGSTLVAAKQNDFKYIGIELTPEYIPIIEARLQAQPEQLF